MFCIIKATVFLINYVIIKLYTLQSNTLHYVTDGSAKLMFSYRKVLYYVPLILMLKCLVDVSDIFIYNALTAGCEDDRSLLQGLYSKHAKGNTRTGFTQSR